MGRRALPKVDDSVDIAPYLKKIEDLGLRQPGPVARSSTVVRSLETRSAGPPDATCWHLEDWFARPAPLEIEVGSGKGMFITNAAANVPEHNFLGIEIAGKYARYCAFRIAKRELRNAIMLHGNAQWFFTDIATPSCVTAVHIYFPDPWWKKRHFKRRIMNETFLAAVYRALRAGGKLHFWTDVESYFKSSCELIRQTTSFKGPFEDGASAAIELDHRTHFERRMIIQGEVVYRSWFGK
jgi:tRNA (guanine-N7-)-methyltransferase